MKTDNEVTMYPNDFKLKDWVVNYGEIVQLSPSRLGDGRYVRFRGKDQAVWFRTCDQCLVTRPRN